MKRVFCTTRFEALHRYEGAPVGVEFLQYPHRHEFHVRVEKVTHADRQIEFILLKRAANIAIETALNSEDTSTWSCERWAEFIGWALEADLVEVSEDGENGGSWSPP